MIRNKHHNWEHFQVKQTEKLCGVFIPRRENSIKIIIQIEYVDVSVAHEMKEVVAASSPFLEVQVMFQIPDVSEFIPLSHYISVGSIP